MFTTKLLTTWVCVGACLLLTGAETGEAQGLVGKVDALEARVEGLEEETAALSERVDGTRGYLARFLDERSVGDSAIFETDSGDVGIGTLAPEHRLEVWGTALFSGRTAENLSAAVHIEQVENPPDDGFNLGLKVDAYGKEGTGESIAIWGISDSAVRGFGVQGSASSPGGVGVFGDCGDEGTGVMGYAPPASGATRGVVGEVESPDGVGGVFNNWGGGTILKGHGLGGIEVFQVAGDGVVTALDFIEGSSLDGKRDIRPLQGALDTVQRLRGVSYRRKMDGKNELGLVAEEVEQVVPEVVGYTSKREVRGVNYGRLTALLIEAVKEQQEQIQALEEEIESLRARGQ